MPPRRFSRFTFAEAFLDRDERLLLFGQEPFRFQAFDDTREHISREADTLFTLAGLFFAPLDRPAGLWWIIADFQPQPILDPTLKLEAGKVIFVPALRVVTEEIFTEARRSG